MSHYCHILVFRHFSFNDEFLTDSVILLQIPIVTLLSHSEQRSVPSFLSSFSGKRDFIFHHFSFNDEFLTGFIKSIVVKTIQMFFSRLYTSFAKNRIPPFVSPALSVEGGGPYLSGTAGVYSNTPPRLRRDSPQGENFCLPCVVFLLTTPYPILNKEGEAAFTF